MGSDAAMAAGGRAAHYPQPLRPPAAEKDRWIVQAEARRLIEACIEPHLRLFVQLALFTAARSGAVFELTWEQVDFDRKLIDYGEGHGNKRRADCPDQPAA